MLVSKNIIESPGSKIWLVILNTDNMPDRNRLHMERYYHIFLPLF